jgi:hypothetical protein
VLYCLEFALCRYFGWCMWAVIPLKKTIGPSKEQSTRGDRIYRETVSEICFALCPYCTNFLSRTARLVALREFKIPSQPGCGNFSKRNDRKGLMYSTTWPHQKFCIVFWKAAYEVSESYDKWCWSHGHHIGAVYEDTNLDLFPVVSYSYQVLWRLLLVQEWVKDRHMYIYDDTIIN